MQLDLWARTYNSFGGLTDGEAISHLLMRGTADYGPTLKLIEITFLFPNSGSPRKTLEELFETYHDYRTRNLPKVTFRRSRETLVIDVASDVLDGKGWDNIHHLTLDQFRQLASETVAALELLRKSVKPKDRFDVYGFLAHCRSALERQPDSDAAFKDLKKESETAAAARFAALSPWEKLGIDFRAFHPDARTILDDPWYWDCADDFAPHGNDMGADLLRSYEGWLRRSPQGDPLGFFERFLKRWELSPDSEDETLRYRADEAAVALAFAELKYRADCRPEVSALARKALARQKAEAEAMPNWEHQKARLEAIQRLSSKLAL